jgi:putative addiction module component (TIGR02574 family)
VYWFEAGTKGVIPKPKSLNGWDMDLSTVIGEVGAWPVEDRLRLMEEIWDGLLDEGYEPELTEELRMKLDRRLEALDANPEDVTTWEAIKEYVRRPR